MSEICAFVRRKKKYSQTKFANGTGKHSKHIPVVLEWKPLSSLCLLRKALKLSETSKRERERERAQVGMSSFLSAFSAASKIFPVKLSLYYLSADSLYTETYSERVKNL